MARKNKNQPDLFTEPHYPFRDKGLLWLKASAAYELFNFPIISDAEWDELTAYLKRNYYKLDVYLKYAIPRSCLISSTASGVCWTRGLPFLVVKDLKNDRPV